MRLARLHVQNLRSIVDSGEFGVQPLLGLVGENNAGKSNLLKAIDVLLSGGAGRLGKDDFTDPRKPLVGKGWFEALTESERRRWKPYLIGDQLILEKRLALVDDESDGREKITTEFHGYRAEPSLTHLSIPKILEKHGERPKWGEIAVDVGLPDYFFVDGKCTKAEYTKGLERYLFENDVAYDPPDVSSTQALGLRSNVTANLPSVYLLPAITDYSEEIDRRSSSSTFRRLMADLSERILQQDPRFAELDRALETIRGLLNRVDQANAPKRFDALASIEGQIGGRLRRLMPSVQGVAMEVEIQGFRDLFSGGVSLTVDDGVKTDVLAKGHGLQRCIVFTLLQTLILNGRSQSAADPEVATQPEHAILLLIEEPELYIHPQLGKLFFDVMRDFSKTDQVIYSTHSPLFIDAYESQQIALVCKPSIQEGAKSL